MDSVILTHAFAPVDNQRLANLCGPMGAHLRSVENHLDVSISRRAEKFRIEGNKPQAERALSVLQDLYEMAARPVPAETVHLMLAGDGAPPAARERRP